MKDCGLNVTIAPERRFAMPLEAACWMNGSMTASTVSSVSTASMLDESASVSGSYLSAAEESREKKIVACARTAK